MKIRGRQRVITDFKADLRGRLKQIGGGIGDGLFEEAHLNQQTPDISIEDGGQRNNNMVSPSENTNKASGNLSPHKSSTNVALKVVSGKPAAGNPNT
jgi:hypothetical protein